jgi:heme/copper-type cytochrome/quinol oxidase subunit 3
LLGIGASATCNGYWLVSRALFRERSSVLLPHILFACIVALLLIARESIFFVETTWLLSDSSLQPIKSVLSETVVLFSSSMLVMSFGEGCRGFKKLAVKQRLSRVLFLSAFSISVGGVVLFAQVMPKDWIAQGGKD